MWYVLYTAWPYDECIDAAYGPFSSEELAESYAEVHMEGLYSVREMTYDMLEEYMVDEPD